MDWQRKLERKWGRFAVTGLMNYVIAGQIFIYAVMLFINGSFYQNILLVRSLVLQGQVWRLVTFVFMPEVTSPLWFALSAYFYYYIGRLLEHAFGTFRLNLYFALGVLGAIASGLLFGYADNSGLLASLFFAYAMLYPEREVLVMMVLPVKVKWLGWFAGFCWFYVFVFENWVGKASLVLSLLGFFVFFGNDFWNSGKAKIRRELWRHKNRNNWR